MMKDCDHQHLLAQSTSTSISTSTSNDDTETRELHASLIADARKKFPTRAELEDAIEHLQAEIDDAVDSFGTGFAADDARLKRAEEAQGELVRKLLPLRLVLQGATDLDEMICALQERKEGAMRSGLDLESAGEIQSEIDELREQLDREERYMTVKRFGQTKCTGCGEMFLTEKKMVGILRTREKHCEECRIATSSDEKQMVHAHVVETIFGKAEGDDSSAGESSKAGNSSDPEHQQPSFEPVGYDACGLKNVFGSSWW